MGVAVAFIVLAIVASPMAYFLSRRPQCGSFLSTLFLLALMPRVTIALVIYAYDLQGFFAPDALDYDLAGEHMRHGLVTGEFSPWAKSALSMKTPSWGMHFWVGGVYVITGRNPLVVQFLHSIFGALVPIIIFLIAETIYRSRMVSKRAALLSAFCPSLILWSAQMLKDPIILLALCAVIYGVLRIRTSLHPGLLFLVGGALLVLWALRFYVFYIMLAAIVMSFLLGSAKTISTFARQALVASAVGGALGYLGVAQQAVEQYQTWDLQTIQASRRYSAMVGQSGFATSIDVGAEGGVLRVLPIGVAYLMLSPFPWQISNLRQAITLPEMIIWWALLPMLASGVWYSVRYRLADTSAILLFSIALLLAYAVTQSNVGTAYRQRSQILIFFILFIAVGLTLRTIRSHRPPGS